MASIDIELQDNYSQRTQELLRKLGNDPDVLTEINTLIGNVINQYVPMKSGALRDSMYADEEGVHWGEGLPYAWYQYMGKVWEPQKAIWSKGSIVGWHTPAGTAKEETDRELGVPGYLFGWHFGYTTQGTMSKWDEVYTGNQWNRLGSGQTAVKAEINMAVTRLVKDICREEGFTV